MADLVEADSQGRTAEAVDKTILDAHKAFGWSFGDSKNDSRRDDFSERVQWRAQGRQQTGSEGWANGKGSEVKCYDRH